MLVLAHRTLGPDSFPGFNPRQLYFETVSHNAMAFGIMRRIRRLRTDVRLVSYWVTHFGREGERLAGLVEGEIWDMLRLFFMVGREGSAVYGRHVIPLFCKRRECE
jgi:hypothetical protein